MEKGRFFIGRAEDGWRSCIQHLEGDEVAEILRDDLLVEYLEGQLSASNVSQGTSKHGLAGVRKLKWTGKKKWFVQLTYGLTKSGLIGDASLTEVGSALGYVFNIDPKNLHRTNMEDRISKEPGDGIKFILDSYLKDAEEKDLNPKYR